MSNLLIRFQMPNKTCLIPNVRWWVQDPMWSGSVELPVGVVRIAVVKFYCRDGFHSMFIFTDTHSWCRRCVMLAAKTGRSMNVVSASRRWSSGTSQWRKLRRTNDPNTDSQSWRWQFHTACWNIIVNYIVHVCSLCLTLAGLPPAGKWWKKVMAQKPSTSRWSVLLGRMASYHKTLNVRVSFITWAKQNAKLKGTNIDTCTNFNWYSKLCGLNSPTEKAPK